MAWRSRSLLLSVLWVIYVLAAAMRASPDRGVAVLALLLLPTALVVVWIQSAPRPSGEDRVSPRARTAMRAVGLGGALIVAAWIAPARDAAFQAIATLGTTMASVGALVAIARIVPLGGLIVVPKRAASLAVATTVGVLGALVSAIAFWQGTSVSTPLDSEILLGAISVVPLASLLFTMFASYRTRRLRRLDLGASERLTASLVAASVAFTIGVPASALGIAPASHVLEGCAWTAAFVAAASCLARNPTFVARAQRVLLAVTLLGAPVALLAASIAFQAPYEGPLVAIVALTIGVVIGLVGPSVARPLGPEQSRWIDALESATSAAVRSEPETAITAILTTLRQSFGPAASSPELWRVDPPGVVTVDRAGYARTEPDVSAPKLLFELAEAEPERTLRTEVLETLEVRRADVRPSLEWLRTRGAMSFTLLNDEDGPLGALLLPMGTRTHPLTLEEVRALRTLADRLTALFSVSSALARAHGRQLVAENGAAREAERALHLEHLVASAAGRNEALAHKAARHALVAPYSAAARFALEELARLGKTGAPVALLSPAGVNPVPYAAFVHGSGPQRGGPFVVVDAAGPDEQRTATWHDPESSPICFADGGTLFIASASALALETQAFLARALADRRSPAGHDAPLELDLVVSLPATIDSLVASGHLHPELADRLCAPAVPLPPLSARPEDLRALFLDRLARIGMRLTGRPIGLDAAALGRLVEHAWPGNDLELDDVLTRAVAIVDGELLTRAHLDQIGFVAAPAPARRSLRSPPPGQHPLGS